MEKSNKEAFTTLNKELHRIQKNTTSEWSYQTGLYAQLKKLISDGRSPDPALARAVAEMRDLESLAVRASVPLPPLPLLPSSDLSVMGLFHNESSIGFSDQQAFEAVL